MNKLKALAGQTVIYGLSTILVRGLNWLISPFHTHVFDSNPAEFGIIASIYAYVAFINVIFMYGMETAFFRYAKDKNDTNKVFSTAFLSLLCTTAVLVAILVALSGKIAVVLNYPNQQEFVIILAFIIGFDTLSNIPFARLRLEGKPLKYVAIKGLNVLINIGLNFFLLYPIIQGSFSMFGYTVEPVKGVTYVFIANLVASIVTFLIFVPSFFKEKFEFCKQTWQDMMRYGLPLIIVGLAGMVNETIDRILLKYLGAGTDTENMAQIGIYSAAYKLSIFMSLVVQAFRMGAEPFFFKQAGEQDARKTYADVMLYFVLFSLVVFLGVSLNLDWLIYILSEKFQAGKMIVPIVLMAYLFLGVSYNLSVWYKLTDKTHLASYITVFGAIIAIVLNVIFIPKYGYIACAWATLITYFCIAVISWLVGRKYYPIPYKLGKIGAYLLLGLALYGLSIFVSFESFALTIIAKNSLILIFIAIAYHIDGRKLLNSKE
ncbi:MAG: oligosaccharide flippase family protein [Chitinophagales bacterium]